VSKNNDELSRYCTSTLMTSVNCPLAKQKHRKAMQEHLNVSNNLDKQLAVTTPNKVWMSDTSHVRTDQKPRRGSKYI